MMRGRLGSCVSDPFLRPCCNHHSTSGHTHNTAHSSLHPRKHHPRCPSRPGTGAQTRHHPQSQLHLPHLLPLQHRHLFQPPPLLPATQRAAAQTLAAASRIALGAPSSSRSFGTSGCNTQAAIALLRSTWCFAVRADLEADVSLVLILTLEEVIRVGWPSAHRAPLRLDLEAVFVKRTKPFSYDLSSFASQAKDSRHKNHANNM